jgi:hypothetical protein
MKLVCQVTLKNLDRILPLRSAPILLGNLIKKTHAHTTNSYLSRGKLTLCFTILILLFRRKYELQQFLDTEENLSCPFLPSHARTSSSGHVRTSSSGQSSSSSNVPPLDKKRYDKQTTKNRIGLSFRNSWGRKESESKSTKKSTSLVMFHFKLVNAVKNAIYVVNSDIWYLVSSWLLNLVYLLL